MSNSGMQAKPPFSEPSEPVEYVSTFEGRIPCDSCGEWIYTRRPVAGGPWSFPPECPVCAALLPPKDKT